MKINKLVSFPLDMFIFKANTNFTDFCFLDTPLLSTCEVLAVCQLNLLTSGPFFDPFLGLFLYLGMEVTAKDGVGELLIH